MYVTDDMIRKMEENYGRPRRASFVVDVSGEEFARIRRSQKNGRNHDVTLYIKKKDKLVVIAKPFYPPGLYRAPSGGLEPGGGGFVGVNSAGMGEAGAG